jgi:transcriptional regulator with XRE-family HTH domain
MTPIEALLLNDKHGKKELSRQKLIVDVTEQIWEAMAVAELSKADLARALETSKSNVTQLLGGQRNMTLSTLADIGGVLGLKVCVVLADHVKEAALKHHVAQMKWHDIVAGSSAGATSESTLDSLQFVQAAIVGDDVEQSTTQWAAPAYF